MTGPWISGESLSPSRLNVHGGSATLATGFSTNTLQPESGTTVQLLSDLSVQQTVAAQRVELGGPPSTTSGLLALRANSAQTDYLFLQDATGAKSNFLLGLRTGDSNFSQVDGLNLYDTSHNTMLVRFSSDSVRFYPPIVAPVFDTGGALAGTYNAALYLRGSSKESQIQAAITAAGADGIPRVYVPANLYPYSAGSVSFDSRIQMVREGGNWSVYDIRAYGAYGDNIGNDTPAIQNAINAVIQAGGGTVYLPTGDYLITSTVSIPAQTGIAVNIVGDGRRNSILRPSASATTALVLGTAGATMQFQQLAGFTITGANTSTHSGTGLHLIRPQYSAFRDLFIEEFDGLGGKGIYIEGTASPEVLAYINLFENCVVTTTQQPLYLQTADENSFVHCWFGVSSTVSSKVTAITINQGRLNRFFGCSINGNADVNSRISYTGIWLRNPSSGDCYHNQVYATWIEGFDAGIWIDSAATNTMIMGVHGSINSSMLSDGGANTIAVMPQQGYFYWQNGSTTTGGSFGFSSEKSMGWYRSGVSTMALTRGRLTVPQGSTQTPPYTFAGGTDCGFNLAATNVFDSVASNQLCVRFRGYPGVGTANFPSGSAVLPTIAMESERSLGWYRSGTSTMDLSYGTLNLNQSRLVSVRTAASLDSTSLATNELAFQIVAGSVATLAIRSGGTIYFFASSASTKG